MTQLEIVDAQVHPNRIGPRWRDASPDELVDATVAAMAAVGVEAALLGEYAGWDERGGIIPGHYVDGIRRADFPVCSRAVERFPDRFAYCVRIERTDPEMPAMIAALRGHSGRLCIRWTPPETTGEWEVFDSGGYGAFFAEAERHQVPVFLWVPNRVEKLAPYAAKFPDLWFVIDHCGIRFPLAGQQSPSFFEPFDAVLRMARFPNVALKWCHAPRLSSAAYPFPDVLPHLRRAVDSFGAQRVMWASDHTEAERPVLDHRRISWAESLYHVLATDVLTESEREWVLGRTVRTILDWPRTAAGGA